ncbi:zinc ribbon domain-containing protein [Haloarcula salina]|uniref:zinc ribbon domain-containing protein n=1 Tax=Haloarcula salina TaxID=1429914 RepID=UPI003C70140F
MVAFVWGMVAFAIGIDASRRGRHSGLWAVLTFVTGLFGAVLYGVVVLTTSDPSDGGQSDDETDSAVVRVCPSCSSQCDAAQNYCGECGAELGPEDEYPVGRRLKSGSKQYCSNCKSEIDREANTCPNCGAVF